jgi:hypothetical protein
MKLILDTLERAQYAAPSLAEADALRVALIDLEALADTLAREGRTLDDVVPALDALDAIQNHVAAQPFETTDMDDGTTLVESLTPDAFPHWLATLERLAQ